VRKRRQLEIGGAAFAAVVTTAALLAGCGTALSVRDRNWQQDVAYLARNLPIVHVMGLTGTTRSAWDAAATRLESQVPRLSDGQVIVGMARMVAMLHDDETQLTMPQSPIYPFAAQWIGAAVYLVAVPAADRELLGAQLVAVDGHPVTAVLTQLGREIDYQDAGLARDLQIGYLNDADLLNWLGVTRSPVKAAVTLRPADGHERTLWLTAVGTARKLPPIAQVPRPLFLQHENLPYWLQTLPSQRVVYLKYNQCLDNDGFQRLAARAFRVLRQHPGYRLIVDLRDNGGGDSTPFQALINDIQADPAINQRGRVFGLINGFTDSSASVDAYNLSQQTNALLVGQQVADPIDEYGDDGNLLRLPHYGIEASYTTAVVNPSRTLYGIPDIVVAPTLHDVLTGYDPVLAAALRY
jgi:hypothetical protein